MKVFLFCFGLLFTQTPAHALDIFNLNVFDQLQGQWDAGFRTRRLNAVADYISRVRPQIVAFQEARADRETDRDSGDATLLRNLLPYRAYVHEMMGADGASYGYWLGSSVAPAQWIEDGFSFRGGVDRRVQAAVWPRILGGKCLGVVSLHLSYQNSKVRQAEALWLLDWVKEKEKLCPRWLVLGDFNADARDREMQILFEGGLKPLFRETKPTIGAFNPIRRIYGENIPSRTIDWALAWNVTGWAEVVLDSPWNGEWVSDHAGVLVHLDE